jgi:hypothetical protein
MVRLLVSAALCLLVAGDASAWPRRRAAAPPVNPCPPIYVPANPLTPAIWGAPAPQPLPPAPPPPKPRPAAGVREEEEEPVKPTKPPDKPKDTGPKDKETPRIRKLDLPLPGDPPPEPPRREPAADAGKAVEQFLIPADTKRAEPRAEVKVGFFNHSDRSIELTVNGESVQLPSEQYVTLRLTRTFTWSEKGQKGNDVVIPPDADGIEIVFRR